MSSCGGEPLSDEMEAKIAALVEFLMHTEVAPLDWVAAEYLRAFAREIQEPLENAIESWKASVAEELGTNFRIAERIGIVEAIKAGKAYEDAEVELFDGLRAALLASQEREKRLAEALEKTADAKMWDGTFCFCGPNYGPALHKEWCLNARQVLGAYHDSVRSVDNPITDTKG